MVLVVSAIFASAFMMVTVYLHLYRLHPHVHRNYNRGCAMSNCLAGFIAPDFDKTVEQEHLRQVFPGNNHVPQIGDSRVYRPRGEAGP